MKTMAILFLIILVEFVACSHGNNSSKLRVNPVQVKPKFIEKQRIEAQRDSTPLKGQFLDYIYTIQPDHKAEGYFISTKQLNDGYAYGGGPYDGVFFSFYLFRGTNKDLVFKQMDGYGVDEKQKIYGHSIQPFYFKNSKLEKKPSLKEVLPLDKIEHLFNTQTNAIKKNSLGKKYYIDWTFYRLLTLPIEGTTISLHVCKLSPEPPFSIDTECLQVGHLDWDKEKFTLKQDNDFKESKMPVY